MEQFNHGSSVSKYGFKLGSFDVEESLFYCKCNSATSRGRSGALLHSEYTWKDLIARFAVVYIMPFTYCATMRLPSLYFVIELVHTHKQTPAAIGAILASSSLVRVSSVTICMYFPRVLTVFGSMAALVGYLTIALTTEKELFIAGNLAIGFNEIISAFQVFAKESYSHDTELLGQSLRTQLSLCSIGTAVVFLAGGYIYSRFDCSGLAWVGVTLTVIQMISFLFYLSITSLGSCNRIQEEGQCKAVVSTANLLKENRNKKNAHKFSSTCSEKNCGFGSRIIGSSGNSNRRTERTKSTSEGSRKKLAQKSKHECSEEEEYGKWLDAAVADYAENEDIPPAWLHYVIALGTGITAMPGMIFSLASLLMYESFGQSRSTIGLVHSLSSASGAAVALLILQEKIVSMVKTHFPPPKLLFAFLGGLTFVTLMTTAPSFVVFAIGLSTMNVFIVPFNCQLAELQGEISSKEIFRKMAPLGQMMNRVANLIASFVAPLLYSIKPTLPNAVASLSCMLFAVVMRVSFDCEKRNCVSGMERALRNETNFDAPFLDVNQLKFSELFIVNRLLEADALVFRTCGVESSCEYVEVGKSVPRSALQ